LRIFEVLAWDTIGGGLSWLFGHYYYSITYPPTGVSEEGITTISAMRGYNCFRGYYPNGVLREEGESLVRYTTPGSGLPDLPINCNIRWGKYYLPDGTLGSEIVDGSGTQTYWVPSGTKIMEVVLQKETPVRVSGWYRNGQPWIIERYKNGRYHGLYESFYENGQKKREGVYDMSERVGKWVSYDRDGKIESVKHFKHDKEVPDIESQQQSR
jgi:hypothetical protein